MKLIASRRKYLADLLGLCMMPHPDWGYVEHWADVWQVSDRLAAIRRLVDDERPGI